MTKLFFVLATLISFSAFASAATAPDANNTTPQEKVESKAAAWKDKIDAFKTKDEDKIKTEKDKAETAAKNAETAAKDVEAVAKTK